MDHDLHKCQPRRAPADSKQLRAVGSSPLLRRRPATSRHAMFCSRTASRLRHRPKEQTLWDNQNLQRQRRQRRQTLALRPRPLGKQRLVAASAGERCC